MVGAGDEWWMAEANGGRWSQVLGTKAEWWVCFGASGGSTQESSGGSGVVGGVVVFGAGDVVCWCCFIFAIIVGVGVIIIVDVVGIYGS